MGVDLHPTIIRFFLKRMEDHNVVLRCIELQNINDLVYRIVRDNGYSPLKVHLSDAYFYGISDFLSKPSCLGRGDYVLVSKPEAHYDPNILEEARNAGIGIGQIGKFMGALNYKNCWEYETGNERSLRLKREREDKTK